MQLPCVLINYNGTGTNYPLIFISGLHIRSRLNAEAPTLLEFLFSANHILREIVSVLVYVRNNYEPGFFDRKHDGIQYREI